MGLRTSWMRVSSFWDHVFLAGEVGFVGLFRRRKRKPPSHSIRKRTYYPYVEGLEKRQLFTTVAFAFTSGSTQSENTGPITFLVSLNASSNNTITVAYATTDAPATQGSD